MKFKLMLTAALIGSLALTGCVKKEQASKDEAAVDSSADVKISAEQQAAIDSVDQPNPEVIALDETVVAEAQAESTEDKVQKDATSVVAEAQPAQTTEIETAATPETTAQ